jgi:hypothetical protein
MPRSAAASFELSNCLWCDFESLIKKLNENPHLWQHKLSCGIPIKKRPVTFVLCAEDLIHARSCMPAASGGCANSIFHLIQVIFQLND